MHWLQNAHVRRYHRHYKESGHIWQGRYKSFPIQSDEHLLTVLRYVERNPVRAKLVRLAERWPWSSARMRSNPAERPGWQVESSVARPEPWLAHANAALTAGELESLRRSVNRGAPFGSESWVKSTVWKHGMESTIRRRGRPAKERVESSGTE